MTTATQHMQGSETNLGPAPADDIYEMSLAELSDSGRYKYPFPRVVEDMGIKVVKLAPHMMPPKVQVLMYEGADGSDLTLMVRNDLTDAEIEEYGYTAVSVWAHRKPDRFRNDDGTVMVPYGRPDTDAVAIVMDADSDMAGGVG